MTKREHHPFGFSRIGQLRLCPASHLETLRASQAAEAETNGRGAQRGTDIHRAIETGDDSDLSGYDAHCAQLCRDFVAQRVAEVQEKGAGEVVARHVEERFDLDLGGETIFGHPDHVVVFEKGALCFDYKLTPTGHIHETPATWQLVGACSAVLQRYEDIEVAVGWVFAPAAPETPWKVRVARAELDRHIGAVGQIIAAARAPEPRYSVGREQCQYCLGRSSCPELAGKLPDYPVALRDDQDEVVIETETGYEIVDEERFLRLFELNKAVKEACLSNERMFRRVLECTESSKLQLRNSGSVRLLRSWDEAALHLPEEVQRAIEVEPAISDIEHAWARARNCDQKTARAEVEKCIGHVIERIPKSPSVQVRKGVKS